MSNHIKDNDGARRHKTRQQVLCSIEKSMGYSHSPYHNYSVQLRDSGEDFTTFGNILLHKPKTATFCYSGIVILRYELLEEGTGNRVSAGHEKRAGPNG